jgi:hypothetical protein
MEHEFDLVIRMKGTYQLRDYAGVNSLDKNINNLMNNINFMFC